MVLHPRHRADCYDLFTAPHETGCVAFRRPRLAVCELEPEAARTRRTWNAQLTYLLELCLGYHPPDFDDPRTVEDWRTLLSPCAFRVREGEDWNPFTCLWRKAP
jgi:hypothetical protein